MQSLTLELSTPYITGRKLSKLAGSLVSTKFVLGDILQLKTRYLYSAIEERISLDSKLNILEFEEARREILQWKENLTFFTKTKFVEYKANTFNFASDASDTGLEADSLMQENHYRLCLVHFC